MKNLLLSFALFTSFIFFYVIPETNAVFKDSVRVDGNTVASGVKVDFYTRSDKHALGFKVFGIADFAELKYEVSYSHESINELITGTIPLSGESEKTVEWLLLGSCSSGGTCVYYDTSSAGLKVTLKDSSGNTEVITKNISL